MRITEPHTFPTSKSPQFPPAELQAMRDFYVTNGFTVVPGLLPADWCQALREVIDDARDRARRGDALGEVIVKEFPGKATIKWLWREYELVHRFFTEAGVQDTVATILGAQSLQYWFDNTFIHEYGKDAEGSQWHHDIAAFPFAGTQIPSLWIALTEVPLDMAPLQMIRGTHRDPLQFRPPVYVDPDAAAPEGYAEMPDVRSRIASGEYEVFERPMAIGDAFVIHPYTLHGSPPSAREDVTRIAFTTRWAGDDVVWKPDAFSMPIDGVDYTQVPVGRRPSGERFPYAELKRATAA